VATDQHHLRDLTELELDTLVCRCEEVTLRDILEAIKAGFTTAREIKNHTRAGMGECQGRTCRDLICEILDAYVGAEGPEAAPPTFRPPVRPLTLRELGGESRSMPKGTETRP